MLTFAELIERYEESPREMDAYLRPLTQIETGPAKPFPFIKLTVLTVLFGVGTYYGTTALDTGLEISFLVMSPFWMGLGILIIRAASSSERTARLICKGTLVMGKVVRAHNRLYQRGVEPARATVVFTVVDDKRHDDLYLRDVVKRVRSAAEAKEPPPEMAAAATLVKTETGAPVRLPASITDNDDTWVGVVEINPERLAENKVVNRQVLLLVAPEGGLVAHL
jgi:hypothetical protein